MKIVRPSRWQQPAARLFCLAACLSPSLLLAHPGHYHPDETDEFDFLRATFFHSHGSLDYVLAAIAVTSTAVALFSAKPTLRISAIVAALGSLAMLPIF